MGKASRDKGKRGEREVRDLFTAEGYKAHRSAQVDGTLSSDVVVTELPCLHVEVKRYARVAALDFLDQAKADAGYHTDQHGFSSNRVPAVFIRDDNRPEWAVLVRAKDFLDLVRDFWN